jgi:hypothetical protein
MCERVGLMCDRGVVGCWNERLHLENDLDAWAYEIDFGTSFEDWPYEDCRTELHDEFAMS